MTSAEFTAMTLVCLAAVTVSLQAQESVPQTDRAFLTWTAEQARQVGSSMRVNGRVGSVFDFRVTHTEHSYNYKLRATWFTRPVVRAAARLAQLSDRLTDEQTLELVREAEAVGDTIIMVEIDPREGSGVIPLDWIALLQPKGLSPGQQGAIKGTSMPELRNVRGLTGVFRRDYDYDVFWLVFPLVSENAQPLFPESVREAELVVRIYNKEGRVSWPIPASFRRGRVSRDHQDRTTEG